MNYIVIILNYIIIVVVFVVVVVVIPRLAVKVLVLGALRVGDDAPHPRPLPRPAALFDQFGAHSVFDQLYAHSGV